MTAAELVAAVQPCLPLPGIAVAFVSSAQAYICVGDDDDGFETLVLADAARLVKGAIADACEERGWVLIQSESNMSIDTGQDKVTLQSGTDAIAWCKAYAKACEKGGAA